MGSTKQGSDFDGPTKPAWVGAMVPVALVLGAAGLFWIISLTGEDGGHEQLPDATQTVGGKLADEKTYYLFATMIQLYPKNLENEGWDLWDNGPDVSYRVLWQGNEVFKSDVKEDSLIGVWSGLSVKLKWSDLLGKKFSPEDVIDGAKVRADAKGHVVIEVKDSDVVDNDEAGSVEIPFENLREGANVFDYEKSADSAIRRITLRALPVDSSLKDLVNLMK